MNASKLFEKVIDHALTNVNEFNATFRKAAFQLICKDEKEGRESRAGRVNIVRYRVNDAGAAYVKALRDLDVAADVAADYAARWKERREGNLDRAIPPTCPQVDLGHCVEAARSARFRYVDMLETACEIEPELIAFVLTLIDEAA